MRDGALTLGDITGQITMLEVACSRCERHGRLRVARLTAEHDADIGLPELRYLLASDCPRVTAASICKQCGMHYPQLDRIGL
jgi:hypothetical protein